MFPKERRLQENGDKLTPLKFVNANHAPTQQFEVGAQHGFLVPPIVTSSSVHDLGI
jgi:hypothetical protein